MPRRHFNGRHLPGGVVLGVVAALAACGEAPDPFDPGKACDFTGSAAHGTGTVQISGVRARTGATRAGAWSRSSNFGSLTVIDAFTVDGEGRPLGELFILYDNTPEVDTVELLPVSLGELLSPVPPFGSFAFIAEGYDPAIGDYDRWLVSTHGCLVIEQAVENDRVVARMKIDGEWRTRSNQSLGRASVTAVINAPLVTLLTPATEFRDSLRATLTGGRAETLRALALDAFQVLHPEQTRMVVAGTSAADTTRELWLSIPGVPVTGDSISLEAASVEEALAGRADRPFAMLRLVVDGNPGTITEIWPSTSGWVKFERVVQNGPAALCGAAWGTFAFDAQGTRLSSGGSRTSLGTMQVTDGRFATRFTPLFPSDTVGDRSRPPTSPTFRGSSPASPLFRLTPQTPNETAQCQ